MEDFPLADTDAGMATLMSLVAIMTTEVLHSASRVDFDFINGKKTKTFAIEMFVSLLACNSACFGKTILT